jgi:RNA polymerase sigma-70 factor (subfamily 1)
MPGLETLELLARGRSGDRQALDDLFLPMRTRLQGLLRRRAGALLLTRADLDDLVQEACIEAVRLLPKFAYQGKDSFFRWLSALALHRLLNLRRTIQADRRDPRREQDLGEPAKDACRRLGEPGRTAPGPPTLVAAAEGIDRLLAALHTLSESDRAVIVMARIEGLALSDIAARTGRSRNAVALGLSRALRKLRQRLDRPTAP